MWEPGISAFDVSTVSEEKLSQLDREGVLFNAWRSVRGHYITVEEVAAYRDEYDLPQIDDDLDTLESYEIEVCDMKDEPDKSQLTVKERDKIIYILEQAERIRDKYSGYSRKIQEKNRLGGERRLIEDIF